MNSLLPNETVRLRKYQGVWLALLKHRELRLSVPDKKLHQRILQAIYKEKAIDVKGRSNLRIEATIEDTVIHLKLREIPNANSI